MKLSLMILLTAAVLGGAPQEKKKEPFDPFADPVEELHNRAERSAKEKRFSELQTAAAELKMLTARISDEIDAGGKDVISAKLGADLDRAEKLVKTIREKAK
jgi:hypothetical protein